MKKINWLALALVLALVLSGCGARLPALEDCVWVMSTLQSMEQEGQVIAYGEGGSSTLKTARELRLTCRATDGTLFLEDHTHGKQYEGTCRIYQKKAQSHIYQVTLEGITGFATVAMTEYADGTQKATLAVQVGEYAGTFFPEP